MAAGASATINQAYINGAAAGLAKDFENVMLRCQEFNTFLQANNLQTAYGFSAADDAAVKSAFSTLNELRLVYEGRATVGTANQAKTFVTALVGAGAHI
jgi:hypothetical protein